MESSEPERKHEFICENQKSVVYLCALAGSTSRRIGSGGDEKGDKNFFSFFHRNPLKSPDSDE
jgi:hypothetical protein